VANNISNGKIRLFFIFSVMSKVLLYGRSMGDDQTVPVSPNALATKYKQPQRRSIKVTRLAVTQEYRAN